LRLRTERSTFMERVIDCLSEKYFADNCNSDLCETLIYTTYHVHLIVRSLKVLVCFLSLIKNIEQR